MEITERELKHILTCKDEDCFYCKLKREEVAEKKEECRTITVPKSDEPCGTTENEGTIFRKILYLEQKGMIESVACRKVTGRYYLSAKMQRAYKVFKEQHSQKEEPEDDRGNFKRYGKILRLIKEGSGLKAAFKKVYNRYPTEKMEEKFDAWCDAKKENSNKLAKDNEYMQKVNGTDEVERSAKCVLCNDKDAMPDLDMCEGCARLV